MPPTLDQTDHGVGPLTWASLLAHWVQFARSALALPGDAEGRRLRAAVPDIIMLQAVGYALKQLSDLPDDERTLGLDRAALLIDRHESALRQQFGSTLPPQLAQLLHDARAALAANETA